MNALYSIRNKGKIALMFFALIVLELVSCIYNESNMTEMEDTFSKVYSDRLIAQDYLYKLEDQIYRRKLAFSESDGSVSLKDSDASATELKSVLKKYAETKFTKKEEAIFGDFTRNSEVLFALERRCVNASGVQTTTLLSEHENITNKLLNQLQQLSAIQLSEAKALETNSKKIIARSSILSHFNWALIIILGIVIQVLVFSSKATLPKQLQNQYLN
jgi:hypothetical protein